MPEMPDLPALAVLRDEVAGCTRCALAQSRTQTVFGVGDPRAALMFVGEGPGREEDLRGEPFVGRSGRLLDTLMVQELGFDRSRCYIANTVKCLSGATPVQLADGSWAPVGHLVRARYAGRVRSVDRAGRLVAARVVGWPASPLASRRVFRLATRAAAGPELDGPGETRLTADHEVLTGMLSHFERTVPACGAVVFSDYGKGGLTHISDMIERGRAAGKPVLVDPKGGDYARYAGASVVTPNRTELTQVIGPWSSEQQLEERVANLRQAHRLDAVLLTRSEEGMSLFDADGHVRIGAQAREVFDVTGAGDTVIAALAAMLAAGLSLREAMPIANRAGGVVVGKFGTATASFEEVFR